MSIYTYKYIKQKGNQRNQEPVDALTNMYDRAKDKSLMLEAVPTSMIRSIKGCFEVSKNYTVPVSDVKRKLYVWPSKCAVSLLGGLKTIFQVSH